MSEALRRALALASCGALLPALLDGCSSATVVLLPEKDGKAAALSVKQGEREVILDQPYAAASATPLGPRAFRSSHEEVEAKFGSALAAQPSRASSFTLYFIEGKDEFTDESKLQ